MSRGFVTFLANWVFTNETIYDIMRVFVCCDLGVCPEGKHLCLGLGSTKQIE